MIYSFKLKQDHLKILVAQVKCRHHGSSTHPHPHPPSGLRIVYNLWGWDDYMVYVLTKEKTLIDYLYDYWIKLKKHLGTSQEALDYQQTWEAFLIATSPNREYYKSMGFRKNSVFPNRLAARAHHLNLDLFTLFSIHENQYAIFRKSSSVLERFVYKYLYPP